MRRLRIYLSSTFEDLKDYRTAAFVALERAGLEVARMEGYTAADERPVDLCLRDVAASDVYVGAVGWRYGYVPPASHGNPEGQSITELEFREAGRRHLRRLLFLAHPDTRPLWPPTAVDDADVPGGPGAKLMALRSEIGTELTTSFFRSPDELATLVLAAIMRSGLTGRPYNVPALRPGVVSRRALMKTVSNALASSAAGGGTNTLIFGPGGFGKTTLAISCCHAPELVRAFPDGLLWVAVGENPDIAAALSELHVVATGEKPAVSGIASIAEALSNVLQGRKCLLVVDDVWRAEDLAPFLTLRDVRLLVTSRIQNLLAASTVSGWAEIAVDEMEPGEAAALLGRGLEVDATVRPTLVELAEALGCWPLLLGLVNARLLEEHKIRQSIGECVGHVRAIYERKGVLGFDRRDSGARNSAVARSVDVGLTHAAAQRPAIERRAAELSIFPEDTPIPVRVLAELWGLDELDAEEDLIRPLDNVCLLEWDRQRREIHLHDMIRRTLEARLAGSSEEAHGRLVDAWGDPQRLPHDYAWRHLAYHLWQGGRILALRELLVEFGWLRAKLEATDITALVSDFDVFSADDPLRMVQGALLLAASYLAADKTQLASQLSGRLPRLNEQVDRLVARTAAWREEVWLRPLLPTLHAPGGPLVRVFRGYAGGHKGTVRSIAMDAIGRWAVSAGNSHPDQAIIFWNLATGTHLRLEGQADAGRWTPLSITGSGDRLVSGHPGEVRAWRVGDLSPYAKCRVPEECIGITAVDDTAARVIIGGPEGQIAIWNPQAGTTVALGVHEPAVSDVAITPDGTRAVSTNEVDVRLWDVEARREVHRWSCANYWRAKWGRGLAISADGRQVAWAAQTEGGGGYAIRQWSEFDGVATLAAGTTFGEGICAFDPEHGRAIVALPSSRPPAEASVWLLIHDSEPRVLELTEIGRGVSCAAISRSGRWAVSADYEHDLMLWDLDRAIAAPTTASVMAPPWDGMRFESFAEGGRYAIFGADSAAPLVWDIAARAPIVDYKTASSIIEAARTGAASEAAGPTEPNSFRSAAPTGLGIGPALAPRRANKLLAKRASTSDEQLRGHQAPILDRATSPNGRWEATASEDGSVRVWDLHTDRTLAVFSDETIFSGCAWAADSLTLAVVGRNDRTHLLRLEGVSG